MKVTITTSSKNGLAMKYKVKFSTKQLNNLIQNHHKESLGEISDGYHTFNELYEHRMFLFSIICKQNKNKSWRSKLHSDGTMYENYFIVGITTDMGDYSYHYHIDYWKYFSGVPERKFAPKWDGHQPKDFSRLYGLFRKSSESEKIHENTEEKDTQDQDLGGYI